MFGLLNLTLLVFLTPDKLVPILELDPISESADVFMQLPFDVTIDKDGRFYVVDAIAKTVFVWNAQGRFLGTMGKGGQGPGEFRFMSMGGPQAYLGVLNGEVLVFDGGNNSVNLFHKNLDFKSSTVINIPMGRTEYFKLTPEGEFLVYQQKWGDTPLRQVILYDKEGKLLRQIVSVPDLTYALRKNKEGGFGGLTLKAFSPRLTVHYNQSNGQVLAGSGDRPEYEVYTIDGKLLRKVPVKLMEQEVSAEDRTEYENTEWVKRGLASGFLKLTYPEKKPFYTHLLPVKGKGHLVFTRSPHQARMRGIMVDETGKTLSRLSLDCGENGNLFSVDGRLIALMVNDEGEFMIREMGYEETGS